MSLISTILSAAKGATSLVGGWQGYAAAALIAGGVGFYGGWTLNGWRLEAQVQTQLTINAQLRDAVAQRAVQAAVTNEATTTRTQAAAQAAVVPLTQELNDVDTASSALHRLVLSPLRVPGPTAPSGDGGGLPVATGGAQLPPVLVYELPQSAESDLVDLAADADRDRAELGACNAWIRAVETSFNPKPTK